MTRTEALVLLTTSLICLLLTTLAHEWLDWPASIIGGVAFTFLLLLLLALWASSKFLDEEDNDPLRDYDTLD